MTALPGASTTVPTDPLRRPPDGALHRPPNNPPGHASNNTSIGQRGKILGALLAVVALVLVGWLAWALINRPAEPSSASGPPGPGGPGGPGGPDAGGRRNGPPSTVATAVARAADIPVLLEALGTVTAAATVHVQPQVSGVLKQVLFTEGQLVKQGQVLAIIDPEPLRIALMQAEAARARDEAQLQNAKLTLSRYQTLLAQDSIARQDVDTQAALAKQLEATVLADRATEATARLNLGYSRVVSPVSGRAGLRMVDPGNYVTTSTTDALVVITQVTPIDVAFSVPQDRVQEIQASAADGTKESRRLVVTALDRSRVHALDQGEFSTLDNQIDTSTGTVKAKARFANTSGTLFPNQFVNVQLLLRTIKQAIVVPVTAVRHGSKGDFVYVLREDRSVSLRTVQRGESMADVVAITSGLALGEQVVTEGADRLTDGAKVQLAGDAARAPRAAGAGDGRRASAPAP